MSEDVGALEQLSTDQRKLVSDNLGLVGVHMRRHLDNLRVPRRDREWEDLFQEGCLGLIQAAKRFRAERGIPFAAFAFPRIHNAVSRALNNKFCTIYVPPKRMRRDRGPSGSGAEMGRPAEAIEKITVVSLTEEVGGGLSGGRFRTSDNIGESGETVTERIRDKYRRAVKRAAAQLCMKTSTRGDRDRLVKVLVEERFMIPHEESKRALRQIARDTSSSYARVAQCEKQLAQSVGQLLEDDPAFVELRRRTRTHPTGGDEVIDERLERDLVLAATREVGRRFKNADPTTKGEWLLSLLETAQRDTEELARKCFERLPSAARERFLEATAEDRRRKGNKARDRQRPTDSDGSDCRTVATRDPAVDVLVNRGVVETR